MFPTIFALLLVGSDFPNVPKDNDLNRFVAPGQEEVVVPSLFRVKAVSLSDIVETENQQYLVQSDGTPNFATYITDPDDATKQRVLMFYGIKNAKEMALRKLITQSKSKKPPAEASFQCLPYVPIGFGTAFSGYKKKARSGDWWFTCMASTAPGQ